MKKIVLFLALFALPVEADLLSRIESSSGWVGYTVAIVEGRHVLCSWDDSWTISDDCRAAASALQVLYEVSGGRIASIRLSSPECRVNRPVQWLTGVDPEESVRVLATIVGRSDSSVAKKAVTALALHRDTEDELIAIARNHPASKVRGNALFWIGQRAGAKAAATLRDAVDHDPDADVKSKAVFGIAQLPDDESIPLLAELLKTHRSAAVRKKAAFWLGQKNDPRALAALEEILMR